jgi:hypothetical protein
VGLKRTPLTRINGCWERLRTVAAVPHALKIAAVKGAHDG